MLPGLSHPEEQGRRGCPGTEAQPRCGLGVNYELVGHLHGARPWRRGLVVIYCVFTCLPTADLDVGGEELSLYILR